MTDMEDETGPKDKLLTPGEVADIFRVDPKTVTRWAKAGKIRSTKTPGGHKRFRESVVIEFLAEGGSDEVEPASESRPKRDLYKDGPIFLKSDLHP